MHYDCQYSSRSYLSDKQLKICGITTGAAGSALSKQMADALQEGQTLFEARKRQKRGAGSSVRGGISNAIGARFQVVGASVLSLSVYACRTPTCP